jgi:hypothetical protein
VHFFPILQYYLNFSFHYRNSAVLFIKHQSALLAENAANLKPWLSAKLKYTKDIKNRVEVK